MPYKTILVHSDLGFSADDRVRFAARLARTFGAHLVGGALAGVSRDLAPAAAARAARAPRRHSLRDEAAMALQRFTGVARDEGVRSSEALLIDEDAGGGLALQARYSDLMVVGQPDRTLPAPTVPADLPERLASHSGRPVLAMPCAGWRGAPGGEAVVAWDASLASARAIDAALPLLRLARRVTVVGRDATPAPVGWLARHGVEAHARPLGRHGDADAALLADAQGCGAALLVMGAGDASAAVLASMTLPVLLAR